MKKLPRIYKNQMSSPKNNNKKCCYLEKNKEPYFVYKRQNYELILISFVIKMLALIGRMLTMLLEIKLLKKLKLLIMLILRKAKE